MSTIRSLVPAGIDPALLANPFYAMSTGINKTQSIAFAVVYGVFFLLYSARLLRKPKYAFVYRFLTLFSIIRVATFIVRYYVASASPTAANFKALLIASGVLVVAGFLFLVEALLALLFQFFCCMRGVSGEGHWVVALARHAVLVGISVLGIIGAVLQIVSVSKYDMKTFDKAKKLRQASGSLFCVVSVYAMTVPFVVSVYKFKPGNTNTVSKPLPVTIFATAGVCLLLESIYRVWSASEISGWITKQTGMDILLIMPELAILVLGIVFNYDNFERVTMYDPLAKKLEVDKEDGPVKEGA